MATRFYLPSTGAAPVSVTKDAGWELEVSSFAQLACFTTKQASAMAYTVDTDEGDFADKDKCCRQWVSEALAAQTIAAQAVELQIRCAEENGANNLFLALCLRVVSNDGSTVRGTLLALTRDALEMAADTSLDGSTAWVNRRLTATTTEVIAQAGDRIVIEIGGGGDPGVGSAHRHGLRIGDADAADLPEDDTDTTDKNPWLEFANTLSFGPATVNGAAVLTGAGALSAAAEPSVTDGAAILTGLGSLSATAEPFIPIPEHRTWAVIYDTDGATKLGAVMQVLEATPERTVNALGSFSLRVPAIELGAAFLTVARQVDIYYEGHDVRMRGIIEKADTTVSADGMLVLDVTGFSLGIELVYANTYLGLEYRAATPATILASLMTHADLTWTALVTGSGYQSITDRYNNMSLLAAALKLGDASFGYVRETWTARQLQLKNTHSASGIVVTNLEAAGVLEGDNPSKIAPIAALPRLSRDATQLFNRVVPYGKGVNGVTFDLLEATRSSPYTKQSFIQKPADVVKVATHLYTSTFQADSREAFDIECSGVNRGLIVAFVMDADTSGNRPIKVAVNGREIGTATNVVPGGGTGARMYIYTFVAPVEGKNTVSWEHLDTAVGDDAIAIAIALEDVWQGDGNAFLRADNEADGTSTAPSVAVTSLADDLVLDIMLDKSLGAGTATPHTSQELVSQTNGVGSSRASVSKEFAASASTTMSWTLNASRAWLIAAMSVKPHPVYYLEDAASVTAYKRRAQPLPDVDMRAVELLTPEAAANTLYDIAAYYLQQVKDPIDTYEVEVVSLPDTEGDALLPGDSLRFIYRGFVVEDDRRLWKSVDATLIVKTIRELLGQGPRRWELTLATSLRENGERDALAAAMVAVQRNRNAVALGG